MKRELKRGMRGGGGGREKGNFDYFLSFLKMVVEIIISRANSTLIISMGNLEAQL